MCSLCDLSMPDAESLPAPDEGEKPWPHSNCGQRPGPLHHFLCGGETSIVRLSIGICTLVCVYMHLSFEYNLTAICVKFSTLFDDTRQEKMIDYEF